MLTLALQDILPVIGLKALYLFFWVEPLTSLLVKNFCHDVSCILSPLPSVNWPVGGHFLLYVPF
ncbi:hypothetical protein DSUL_50338 [Desulfovibrionales bacterium]